MKIRASIVLFLLSVLAFPLSAAASPLASPDEPPVYRRSIAPMGVLAVTEAYSGTLAYAPQAVDVWLPANTQFNDSLTISNTHPLYPMFWSLTNGLNVVRDGSFEEGIESPAWETYSLNFGTPLANTAMYENGAHSGDWWVWFGGTGGYEEGIVTQTLTIPAETTTLEFWLWMPIASAPGTLVASIDGNTVFSATHGDAPAYTSYTGVSLDVGVYADGASHTLVFHGIENSSTGAITSFFVDDVRLRSQPAWLSLSPDWGVLEAVSETSAIVSFDAPGLSGVYTGTLTLDSTDPNAYKVTLPVTMSVGNFRASTMSGNWSAGSTWASGSVPAATDWVTVTAGTTVTVDGAAGGYHLAVEPGGTLVIPEGSALTVEDRVENAGTMRQTATVDGATGFLNVPNAAGDDYAYYGLTITPEGAGLGATTVEVKGHQACTTDDPGDTVDRCFSITPTSAQAATVRFYYLESEQDGFNPASVEPWHWNGTSWDPAGTGTTRGSTGDYRWCEVSGVSAYSPFVLRSGSAPTALTLAGFGGRGGALALTLVLGLACFGAGYALHRRR